MLKNLKIDIIYYEIPTDFEFEFNLGGCCPSRVLTESAAGQKELVSSLAKAIGRSRVIIAMGKVSGEDGLVSTISKATGIETEAVNNSLYNITSDEEISILKGAIPLVGLLGDFAGCIIESGPQSIIILTDNRKLRNEVMKSLVNSYIFELSNTTDAEGIIEPPEEVTPEEPINETEDTESTEILTDEIPVTPFSDPQAETENDSEPTDELNDENDSQNDEDESESEEPFEDIFSNEKEDETNDFNDDFDFEINSNDDFENGAKKLSGLKIAILILAILLIATLGILAYFVLYIPLSQGIGVSEYITQLLNL